MRINTVIPVEEALEVDSIAYFEVLYSLVNICIGTAEIGLNEELKFLIAESHIEVEVIAFSACAVPLVEVSNFVAVSILGSLDSQTLKETFSFWCLMRSSVPRRDVASKTGAVYLTLESTEKDSTSIISTSPDHTAL